jgi:hypothetical protein
MKNYYPKELKICATCKFYDLENTVCSFTDYYNGSDEPACHRWQMTGRLDFALDIIANDIKCYEESSKRLARARAEVIKIMS